MRKFNTVLDIDLHLFDGAAGAGAAGDGGSGDSGAGTAQKAEFQRRNGSSRRSGTGDLSQVVYGKAAEDPASSDAGKNTDPGKAEPTAEDRRKAFNSLIEGEYKDLYEEHFQEKFQKAFNRRFSEAKGMESTLAAQKPVIDMMMQRYGIENGDMSALQTAIEQDNRYWEEAAEESGMSVEQYKTMKRLEREVQNFKVMQQRAEGEKQMAEQVARWRSEAEAMKGEYPSFNLEAELQNRSFAHLLQTKWPVKDAYEMIHREEIAAAREKAAAQKAEERLKASYQSNAARPSENGNSSQSTAITKSDVNALSRKDRAEIVRRVKQGAKISF